MAIGILKPGRIGRFQGSLTSGVFRTVVIVLSLLVGALVVVSLLFLLRSAIREFGLNPAEWVGAITGSQPVMKAIPTTIVVVGASCVLAATTATILAWLNEGTTASIGTAGTVLPVVPFLMPALSLPLGWVFMAAPTAGYMNALLRSFLENFGIHLTEGPLNIYSMWGLIFVYTIFLTGFAYLVMAPAIRNVDTNIIEAARIAGASPLKVFYQILVPSIKSSYLTALLICLIPGLAMFTVPTVIGRAASIEVLSTVIVTMVRSVYPPQFGLAFASGLMLLIPILALWAITRSFARGTSQAFISTTRGSRSLMILPRGFQLVGRTVLYLYMIIAVVLPVIGLFRVSGVSFWSGDLDVVWNPIPNFIRIFETERSMQGILNSVVLGIVGAVLIMFIAQVLTYGQQVLPRLGGFIDGLVKSPSTVANILLAMGLLIFLGGPPFNLAGSRLILLTGFLVSCIPFASVVAGSGMLQIGRDVIHASQVSGGSEARTFRKIVFPLTRNTFLAGCVLVFILIVGDVNMSIMLATTQRPTIGFVMMAYQIDSSFPVVASYALLVSIVNVFVTACAFFFVGRGRKQ